MLTEKEEAFKKRGPWAQATIDVVVPFYNEEANAERTHQLNKRLERIFNIKNYIYINNGSKDGTFDVLTRLAAADPLVKIVQVPVNQGYGFGMQKGIHAATADFILTNHTIL